MKTLWLGKSVATGSRIDLSADSLVTHGVCVGMTGSGKTGLCIALLEELAAAGVPVVAIDPKGDLTNLALTEPPVEGAASWQAGQASWGITPADIAAWKAKVDLHIYTPGSNAAEGVDVLAALRRPAVDEDEETRRERVLGTVSALLGLAGEEADPVRSPAHVVLSRILSEAWARGEDPDLEQLVALLLDPPFAKVGVFPTDRFYPPDDRFELARKLNAVLVSPAFAAWNQGSALDPERLFGSTSGKTPVHIFTIAHLSEVERQFFVGLLLERVALWTRSLPGSTRLRGLVFFDEVWGYLPPHPKNPPTKRPLLTLLKQARAVGIGVMLATQNPVDLDYKALANTGTWLLGRLQTRNDRDRVAEGLSTAGLDRSSVDQLLDGLQPRRFLLYQSTKAPAIFDVRWTRTTLTGPLTRAQLRALAAAPPPNPAAPPPPVSPASVPSPTAAAPFATSRAGTPAAPAAPFATSRAGTPAAPTGTTAGYPPAPTGVLTSRPHPPAAGGAAPNEAPRAAKRKIKEWLLDPRVVFSARFEGAFTPEGPAKGRRLRPGLLVQLSLRFDERRAGFLEERQENRLYFPLEDELPFAPLYLPLQNEDLLEQIPADYQADPLPHWIDEAEEVERLVQQVVEQVIATESSCFWVNPALKLNSHAGENEEAFRQRCRATVEARIDAGTAAMHEKIKKEVDRLEEQARKLDSRRARQESERSSRQTQELIHAGETLLGWFTGRRRSLATSAGRLASHRQRVSDATEKVGEIDAELAAIRRELFELEEGLETEIQKLRIAEELLLHQTRAQELSLDSSDVKLRRAGILWVPVNARL